MMRSARARGGRELIELCAGSAAVALALGGMKPPVPIMGNKRTYAAQVLAALGVEAPSRITLVEPGEWGHTLTALFAQPSAVADAIIALKGDDRALFDRLRTSPAAVPGAERAATHLFLSARTYRGKPVYPDNDGWRTHGFDPEYRQPKQMGENTNPRGWSNPRPLLAKKVRAFDAWEGPPVRVLACRAEDVTPTASAWVYIDPPYGNATGYPHDLTRACLLDVARRWAEAGARVAVSEAEPLPLHGWCAIPLTEVRRSRAFGAHKEWLTVSPERVT